MKCLRAGYKKDTGFGGACRYCNYRYYRGIYSRFSYIDRDECKQHNIVKHRYQKKRIMPDLFQKGFTLIELLIVIALVGILASASLPVSSHVSEISGPFKAEEVLIYLSSLCREAFLYSEEKLICSQEGRLLVNDGKMITFEDMFVQIDKPVKMYKSGATSREMCLRQRLHIVCCGYPCALWEIWC